MTHSPPGGLLEFYGSIDGLGLLNRLVSLAQFGYIYNRGSFGTFGCLAQDDSLFNVRVAVGPWFVLSYGLLDITDSLVLYG